MAEMWWSDTQAWRYVCHHYEPPWEFTTDATNWLWSCVWDGTVRARYHDAFAGISVPIDPSEWQGGWEWIGWEEQILQGGGSGVIQLDGAAVKRLCTAQPARKTGHENCRSKIRCGYSPDAGSATTARPLCAPAWRSI